MAMMNLLSSWISQLLLTQGRFCFLSSSVRSVQIEIQGVGELRSRSVPVRVPNFHFKLN